MPQLFCDPDPAQLAAVDAQCFAEPWAAADYAALLANPAVRVWLLHDEGAAVGLLCFQHAGREGELYRIGVVPPARGRGLGGWLLRCWLEHLRAVGVRTVHLEVRVSNGAARRLYARAGFTEAGRRPGYYREPPEDAVVCVWEEAATRRG